jgi:site-specific DNA recombinase
MLTGGELNPRNGVRLKVLIFVRISTDKQDERSLGDQEAFCREYLYQHYVGPVEFKIISGTGSGEALDRLELEELLETIESRTIDVVLCEDISRICRRQYSFVVAEACEDAEVRLIGIHDRIDTGDPGWRDSATMVTWHHERSNRDTSHRIKRTLNNRFDNGGCVQTVPFGYVKRPGSSQDADLRKDPAAENFVLEMFRRLEDGANFAEVADWLNREQAPLGPYSRSSRWNDKLVASTIRNPIFKGIRERNRHMSKRVNKTGRHKTVKAPPEMLRVRKCPHLAYIDPARYDALIHTLQERNAWCRRSRADRPDSLRGVPKKSTRFPGQHLRCGISGRYLYWHGKNTRRVMVCSGATKYECWNSLFVDGAACAEAVLGKAAEVMAAIGDELERH